MFKYLKTLNAGTVSPEVLELPTGYVDNVLETFEAGAIVSLANNGKLTSSTLKASKYYTLEAKASGDGKSSAKCFKITPGMLFLGKLSDPTGVEAGLGIGITRGSYLSLGGTDGEILEVVSPEDGTVIFTLN